jgi:uncharacterized membrane protein affecting hemolysin expression
MSKEEIIVILNKLKKDYLVYRGSSFDENGTLIWAKDDALSYAEGLTAAIEIIQEDDKELMERLGSDYDDQGIPYWYYQ